MKISRYILRRLILKEIKSVLSSDHLFEGIIDDLSQAALESSTAVDDVIQAVKDKIDDDFVDDVILDAMKTEEFEKKIKEMDDDTVALIFGRLRSSLMGSTTDALKDVILKVKTKMSDHKFFVDKEEA